MTTIEAVLSRDRARTLTDEVREDVAALWGKVLELFEGGAHVALGYESWKAYWESEFGDSGSRGFQMVRVGRVARLLQEKNMPVPTYSIARELAPLLQAPEVVPEVWGRAIESSENPSVRQVKDLVAAEKSPRGQKPSNVKRTRNRLRVPLENAHGAALSARDAVTAVLATKPEPDALTDWLATIAEIRDALSAVEKAIRKAK